MWSPTDALRFREYLTHNNANLISHLTEIVPSITVGADSRVEGVALQGAFKEGYLFALQKIKEMSIIQNKQDDASSSTYVSM